MIVSTASGRVTCTRWLLELSEYSFRIEFIPGKVNDVADALSRLRAATGDAADGILTNSFPQRSSNSALATMLLLW